MLAERKASKINNCLKIQLNGGKIRIHTISTKEEKQYSFNAILIPLYLTTCKLKALVLLSHNIIFSSKRGRKLNLKSKREPRALGCI